MGERRWQAITPEKRRNIIALAAKGATYREIVDQMDTSQGAIGRVLKPLGGVIRPEHWCPSAARLSLDDRIEVAAGLERGLSFRAIGHQLGRAASTICREVANNGGRNHYRPMGAHKAAQLRARRPKCTKLTANPSLCARVIEDLNKLWSPEQIALRLRDEFGNDKAMWISHETIYKSLYVQGRGELRRELTRCLRTGRAKRRSQSRMEARGRIPNMVMISERPAESADRAVPGHWEGDLILGKANKSAVGTLVERSTRYVMLMKLDNQTAEHVKDQLIATVARLPMQLWRSLTWDQGRELADHELFRIDTGIDVYFCDPHSPWQRGSNENTNGLLRQYMPKATDLSVHSQDDLDAIARSLNGRPRETLGGQTPAERLTELVAMTG